MSTTPPAPHTSSVGHATRPHIITEVTTLQKYFNIFHIKPEIFYPQIGLEIFANSIGLNTCYCPFLEVAGRESCQVLSPQFCKFDFIIPGPVSAAKNVGINVWAEARSVLTAIWLLNYQSEHLLTSLTRTLKSDTSAPT